MRKIFLALVAFVSLGAAHAEQATVGKTAPSFTLTGADGREHSLAEYRGKVVVLEWFNQECPFVKKHYGPKNMQTLQKEVVSSGGVWLTINSSAPGKQGYIAPEKASKTASELGLNSTQLLLDPMGTVGKLYGARTTPHMFVIGKDGVVAYAGAIDDRPSTDASDITEAKNYIRAAVAELNSGKAVTVSSTEPYGCSVKYQS